MVFQDAALFPWYKIVDNVAYGLVCAGIPGKEAKEPAPSLPNPVSFRAMYRFATPSDFAFLAVGIVPVAPSRAGLCRNAGFTFNGAAATAGDHKRRAARPNHKAPAAAAAAAKA